ncbi:hypothetical protein BVY03_04275, partial [bacterium K02(2017)]
MKPSPSLANCHTDIPNLIKGMNGIPDQIAAIQKIELLNSATQIQEHHKIASQLADLVPQDKKILIADFSES